MIVNLHGFNSAGNNNSFAQLRAHFTPGVELISPTYTVHNFARGCADILQALDKNRAFQQVISPLFVGSSTGALYAETLARKFGGRVVLVNPVVDPVQLKPLIGPQQNYATGVEYEFTMEDWETFAAVKVDLSLPRLVFIEDGDEKLDHRLTRAHYAEHGEIIVTDGDSHRYTHWAEALSEIEKFIFVDRSADR